MLDEYRIESMSVGQYLDEVNNENIKIDQAVQREFCWNAEMMNALIYSAISRKIYIPNFILAEEKKKNGTKQTYVVDAGQRTETLYRFKYEGYRITKNLRSFLVPYNKKKVDENGEYIRDEYGNIECEIEMFDIRNKTYEELPDELKSKFNGCPLTMAIYQDCTTEETSELVLLYNNHMGMNVSQKSLTYVGKFAEEIKRIKNSNRFLKDCTSLTENDKKKGLWERVISESVMAVKHFENWKKTPKDMCNYLNENSSVEEYREIENYYNRLVPYTDKLENKEVSELFTSKNMFIWMMVFDKFNDLHISDDKFAEFLQAFVSGLKDKQIDNENWTEIDADKHTKDRSVINKKVNYLVALMRDFLHIEDEVEVVDEEETNEENVNNTDITAKDILEEFETKDINDDDIDLYEKIANEKSEVIDDLDSWMLSDENRISFVALVGHAVRKDMEDELDGWLPIYERDNTYISNPKQNFLHMVNDFDKYCERKVA